ncbi:TPA: hypothetical protein ACVEY8_004038 [Yersinia enterocolitica]|uniref:hypothetical protein n=1 Tax=Yersinia enterocolitica TaxID=630 RepID=UPI001C8DC402|nr:hypothetical protein [Yersinia enterocolitica]ELI8161206.1 hypothetical protein [Yersinia enterocolitica]MBX9496766.1 hypothetical protein [Yersinia enterocolitica]HEB2009412.1 hypothetical protein [Yersinia enterocolitica]HEG1706411.1 hypothetical protein [Yersinia enterocolitica]
MKVGLYSVTDKALFDALNQTKVTNDEMKSLFFKRGIIISKDTKRKALALDFSRYFHGFDDYKRLSEILGSVGRREKVSVNIINANVEKNDIEVAVKLVCEELQKEGDQTDFTYTENGIEVKIKYVKLDYTMNEFRQSSTREAIILIEKNENNEFIARFPQNIKAREFNEKLINKIKSENTDIDVFVEEITLESVKEHTQRTYFFKKLIDSIPGYNRVDVTDVYVTHPILEEKKKESHGDEDEDDEDDLVVDLGCHISKASLKGRGVLESKELNDLLSQGFYITKIVWVSVINGFSDSNKFEFEAQFVDTDDCKLFSYLVRGQYKYKSVGDYTNRQNVEKYREVLLSSLIEQTARKISDEIIEKNSIKVKTK